VIAGWTSVDPGDHGPRKEDAGRREILGWGVPHGGDAEGAVVNVDATVKSIRQSVTEAERMTGLTVESVFVGISGPLIQVVQQPRGHLGEERA